jgi:membrane fusion protein (multidrug efflux system)
MNENLQISSGLMLAFSLGLAGCGHKPETTAPASLPAATVRVQTVESKRRVATEEIVGTVRAKLRSVIEAKVSGKIEQLRVVPGQSVTAGELLVQLNAHELQSQLDQAQAVRQQAEGDLKRFASLLEQKILSQSEYDGAQSKFRVADAGVKEAETMLGYTKVTAPFAGVITRKHADVGDLAVPGKPLLEMEDSRALRLEADVPEAVVGRLALGDKLPVRVSALETGLEGVVSEIAPSADPNSRTFLVKLDLPDTPGLRAGQFGRVAMPVGETSALRIPARAVIQRGQMELVFVVKSGRAELRLVKTGKRLGDEVELVSGVEAGEQIVSEGAAGLADGQPVSIPNAK